MEIICSQCNKKYSIDERKLPQNGKVYVRCVSCNNKIEINIGGLETISSNSSGYSKRPLEFFDSDKKTALIYCKEPQALVEIQKQLKTLDFHSIEIKNVEDIKHYFRFNTFDLVLLYQHAPDMDQDLKEVLFFIHNMQPSIRRRCLVLYCYLGGNRYDLFDAFSRGVDRCINPMDIRTFTKIVPELLNEKDANYKIFFKCKERVEEGLII